MDICKYSYSYPYVFVADTDQDELNQLNTGLKQFFEDNNFSESQIHDFLQNKFISMIDNIRSYSNDINSSVTIIECNGAIIIQIQDTETDNNDIEQTQVAIYNPKDKIEARIKECFSIGDVSNNGYTGIYNIIGADLLKAEINIPNLSGGKRKKKFKESIQQYMDVRPVQEGKRALQIADIFDEPHYIEKEDNRGKSGYFIDRSVPVLIKLFCDSEELHFITTVTKLAKSMGIVNNNYKYIKAEELSAINPDFTSGNIQKYYKHASHHIETIIFNALNRVQDLDKYINDYSGITYFDNFEIHYYDFNGARKRRTSSKEETLSIKRAQYKVLQEFKLRRISDVYMRKLQRQFYDRVCEICSIEFGFQMIEYFRQIEIYIEPEILAEIASKYDLSQENIKRCSTEINHKLSENIMKDIENDYAWTNKKADEEIEKHQQKVIEECAQNKELREYVENGIIEYQDVIEKNKPRPFRHSEKFVPIQRQLNDILVKVST